MRWGAPRGDIWKQKKGGAVAGDGLGAWLEGFRARAAGVPAKVLERALAEVAFLPEVIAKDRTQAEFSKTIWAYLDAAVSEARLAGGFAALAAQGAALLQIEAAYGVPKEVLIAVWGMESNYGAMRGDVPVISALATLAFEGRRAAFFEAELLAALRIVAAGDVEPAAMRGSWAGAMGHTQFMPSSYLRHAVDFDGDGRRDIWGDDPVDALASTAAYLAAAGWQAGQPWGVEVTLPAGFDFALSGKAGVRPVAEWAALGLRGPLPEAGAASVLLPAGAQGPALLIFANFRAIAAYNAADAYVLAVGHLADRLRGAGPIVADWPRGARALSRDERAELQRLLARAGYDPGGADGLIGPNSMAALRKWQRAAGQVPDGHASLAMLEALRRADSPNPT